MKILIVEDDFGSRKVMQKYLSLYGDCDIAVDGEEAIEAFGLAWEEGEPYSIIFLDIMMPKIDGQQVLKMIRSKEKEMGIRKDEEVKVIMTTVLGDPKNVMEAFHKGGANSYLVKPFSQKKLLDEIRSLFSKDTGLKSETDAENELDD
jgi:two-component system chemotaxis response regulator CheY